MEPLPLAPETDIPEKAAVTTQPSADAPVSAHVEKADDTGSEEGDAAFLKLSADNVVADEAAIDESKADAAADDKTATPGGKKGVMNETKGTAGRDTEKNAVPVKTHTMKEVSSHNTPDDIWLIVGSDIYDVTKFQHEHPGGAKIMAGVAGKDATKKYDKYHRRAILDQYKPRLRVGTLDPSETSNGSKKGFLQRLGFGKGG